MALSSPPDLVVARRAERKLELEHTLDAWLGPVEGRPTPFTRALRARRQGAGKSLAELAEALGMSRERLAEHEQGYRPPLKYGDIERAAVYLNCSPVRLHMAAARTRGYLRIPVNEKLANEDLERLVRLMRRSRGS